MTLPTMPRLPRIGRRRDALSAVEDTPPGSAALSRARATSGATVARDTGAEASAVVVKTDEMRRRRTATIIAASLLVSAIASGVATVIARRARLRRARGSDAQPGQRS